MKRQKLTRENLLAALVDFRSANFKTLAKIFSVRGSDRKKLKEMLKELKMQGEIIRSRRRFIPKTPEVTLTGSLDLSRYGYAFLIPDDPMKEDIFIAEKNLFNALHRDRVKIALINEGDGRRGPEGYVTQIIERGLSDIIGRYYKDKKGDHLRPVEEKIPLKISIEAGKEYREGDILAARIDWSTYGAGSVQAKVIKNFKDLTDPNDDVTFVAIKNGLPLGFSGPVLKEADSIEPGTPKREDLRHLKFITVDPEDAKDFDDAVYLEKNDNGFSLFVSISDVSEYVGPRTSIDKEALRRGNSCYFPGSVIPMLPERISSGLGSLDPSGDKLAITAKMTLSHSFDLKKVEIFESLMRNHLRTNYDEVLKVVLRKGFSQIPSEFNEMIGLMYELSQRLFEKRMAQGGIDFDLPEPRYICDEKGGIKDIVRHFRTASTQIIEEFMLLANRAVSEFLKSRRAPQLFRIHEEPDAERLKEFYEKARTFGYSRVSKDLKSSKDLNDFLKMIKDQGRSRTLRYLLLRSMKQARYSTSNLGHYGLGFKDYMHFTSPIRRYPDLINHRILKGIIGQKGIVTDMNDLIDIAKHCSETERKANECERDILKIKSVRFMQDKIGRVFEGYISGKTKGGFFIELKDHMVEGYCPKENMNPRSMPKKRFKGFRRESFEHGIGDQVKVKLEKAVLEELSIEFSILN